MQKPYYFTDEQMNGDFKMMKHEHYFKPCDNGTIMIDMFQYEIPYGTFGKIFDKLFLFKYVNRLLQQRNDTIREYAESDKWKPLLIK